MLLPPRLGPYFHCQKSSNDIFSSKQIITGISEYTDSVVSARKYQLNNIYFHINKGQSPRSSINQMTHGRPTVICVYNPVLVQKQEMEKA